MRSSPWSDISRSTVIAGDPRWPAWPMRQAARRGTPSGRGRVDHLDLPARSARALPGLGRWPGRGPRSAGASGNSTAPARAPGSGRRVPVRVPDRRKPTLAPASTITSGSRRARSRTRAPGRPSVGRQVGGLEPDVERVGHTGGPEGDLHGAARDEASGGVEDADVPEGTPVVGQLRQQLHPRRPFPSPQVTVSTRFIWTRRGVNPGLEETWTGAPRTPPEAGRPSRRGAESRSAPHRGTPRCAAGECGCPDENAPRDASTFRLMDPR